LPLTIKQFCQLENISISTFKKMGRDGIGPHVSYVAGMTLRRITPESYREWKKVAAERERAAAPQIEAERLARIERNKKAARLAVQSPRHVSKRRRGG
jgi:hypothetical protein